MGGGGPSGLFGVDTRGVSSRSIVLDRLEAVSLDLIRLNQPLFLLVLRSSKKLAPLWLEGRMMLFGLLLWLVVVDGRVPFDDDI